MSYDTLQTWLARHSADFQSLGIQSANNNFALRIDELFRALCLRIKEQNLRAVELALSFLQTDPEMPFGQIMKSQIARALAQATPILSPEHKARITNYRDKLNSLAHPPREAKEFDRLLRRLNRV